MNNDTKSPEASGDPDELAGGVILTPAQMAQATQKFKAALERWNASEDPEVRTAAIVINNLIALCDEQASTIAALQRRVRIK